MGRSVCMKIWAQSENLNTSSFICYRFSLDLSQWLGHTLVLLEADMPLKNPRGTLRFFLLAAICVAMPSALRGQADSMPQHHHAAMAANSAENKPAVVSGLSIPDVNLVDQHGRRVRFYSDLVKGKVVAINTIFTTCTTICPLMGANYSKLGKLLTDSDRARMNLISISIDPSVDTPARLDQWSKAFGPVASNWTLLTGTKSDVDSLLKALQVFTADKQDHAPVVLIGGDGAEWARASALQAPAILADLVHSR